MSKHYIFGDVHGSGAELNALIQKISPKAEDELILVGDVFDRGFQGGIVWRLIQDLHITVIRGNHEQKMLQFLKGERPQGVPLHYHWILNELINVTKVVTKKDLIDYLDSLPLLIERGGALVAHAGINILNPKEPNVSCNVYGNPTPDNRKRDQKWWLQYEGNQMVVYGHLVTPNGLPMFTKNSRGRINSVCIDTAVVHGGNLTSYCIETKEVIQYRSGINHYHKMKEEVKKNPPNFRI